MAANSFAPVMVALRTPPDAQAGRRIGIAWMILAALGAIATALIGIAYFQQNPELTLSNFETVFLLLSQILFHPFIAGLVLAAVLAAIMSTISSQLIVRRSGDHRRVTVATPHDYSRPTATNLHRTAESGVEEERRRPAFADASGGRPPSVAADSVRTPEHVQASP